jgi:hypothetical protein
MAPRTRVLAFGSAAALVIIGGICAVVINGYTGELVALSLITLGLGAVLLLVFLEIGLSEDHEVAKEEDERRRQAAKREASRHRPPRSKWPRRPG